MRLTIRIVVLAFALAVAFGQSTKTVEPQKTDAEMKQAPTRQEVAESRSAQVIAVVRNVVEIIALLAAAAFFAYKILDGWGLVNLSMELGAVRDVGTEADLILISLKLIKGDRGSLELYTVEMRCTPTHGKPESVRIPLIYPLKLKHGAKLRNDESRVHWESIDHDRPCIHLPPGESAQYSHIFRVPHMAPCIVEAIVVGKRPISTRYGQWRGSISVPFGQSQLLAESNRR